jgi:hypothetical protein
LDCSGYIEDEVIQNLEQKKKVKQVENQDSIGKTNFFFGILPFNPWAV